MDENGLLVRVFALIAVVIAVGWFLSFIVVPFIRPDYQPPPEMTVAITALLTALSGLLTGAYFKARRAPDESKDGRDGDGDAE